LQALSIGIRNDMDVNLALSPQAIAFARLDSKPKVLSKIAQLLADAYGLDVGEVLEGLEAREALGSTGFGRGVAIPHCRSKTIRRPSLALIRLEAPIDYAAADALPVTLVCGLVSPENAGATHLHALAAISRLTRDETMLQMLADAPTTEAVYALLTNQFLRDAA
jgi:PTS system nitrogen regulatory IIA component